MAGNRVADLSSLCVDYGVPPGRHCWRRSIGLRVACCAIGSASASGGGFARTQAGCPAGCKRVAHLQTCTVYICIHAGQQMRCFFLFLAACERAFEFVNNFISPKCSSAHKTWLGTPLHPSLHSASASGGGTFMETDAALS